MPDITRVLVEVEDDISLLLLDYANGVFHRVHDVGMDLGCVYENVGILSGSRSWTRWETSSRGSTFVLMWTSPIVLDRARLTLSGSAMIDGSMLHDH